MYHTNDEAEKKIHLDDSLVQASESDDLELVKELLADGADINAVSQYFMWAPIHAATRNGNINVVI